mgnify:CR=1 FL=1
MTDAQIETAARALQDRLVRNERDNPISAENLRLMLHYRGISMGDTALRDFLKAEVYPWFARKGMLIVSDPHGYWCAKTDADKAAVNARGDSIQKHGESELLEAARLHTWAAKPIRQPYKEETMRLAV